jgi:hypothetical protein
MSVVAEDLL